MTGTVFVTDASSDVGSGMLIMIFSGIGKEGL